jgi:hypothetical protein
MTTGKKVLIGVVALGAAVFLFFKFYGASLVKSGVETYGPEYTGTSVTVSDISFSPLSGNFGFSGLEVGNPPGYQGDKAFRLGEMRVDVAPSTVLSDVVRIHDLAIVDPEFAVEIKKGKLNAKTILDHLNRYGSRDESASETRVQIENVTITGGKVTVTGLPLKDGMDNVALPDIHLTNIGTESENGVSFADASATVMGAVVASLTHVVAENQAKGLLGGLSDKVKGLFGSGDDDGDATEDGN